jgi:hypothetical protein
MTLMSIAVAIVLGDQLERHRPTAASGAGLRGGGVGYHRAADAGAGRSPVRARGQT